MWKRILFEVLLDIIDRAVINHDGDRGRGLGSYLSPEIQRLNEESAARESAFQAEMNVMLDEINERRQEEARILEARRSYIYEDDDAAMEDISAAGIIAPKSDEENTEMESI